ncbi:unnamed protein product [Linum tenue]|uniref:Uncharacterized protein n=1 Tax=Linum tenue TaxID=586396 RepID=A0AAV0HYB8_9ROSI|nr:unnamed protein product [Linum tenue]
MALIWKRDAAVRARSGGVGTTSSRSRSFTPCPARSPLTHSFAREITADSFECGRKRVQFWIQWHGLRSISSFLESLTPDISRQSEVKDSVVDILLERWCGFFSIKVKLLLRMTESGYTLTMDMESAFTDQQSELVVREHPDKNNEVPSVEHNGKIMGEILDLIKYLYSNFEGPSLIPNESFPGFEPGDSL